MGRTRISLAICTVAALALAGSATVSSGAAVQRVTTPVVPSLEPEKTEALWRSLVRRPRHQRAQGECRPLRGVFYAATDWLRLATKLAANASPCAEYYVSIPPIVGDKTSLRPGQAERIRALGSNFHALAEIHWTSWSRWVAENGTTWHAAGVEARRRMAQAGFEIAAGDTWAVNEFPSTVRSGAGDARANARELVRGLYEGDGTRTARGVVFVVGLGQPTTNCQRLPDEPPELARRHGVLDGHEHLRQRLVAGGLRRLPQVRRAGRSDHAPARLPQRLPPARARRRARRAADDRARARIPPDHVQPASPTPPGSTGRATAGR